MKTLVFAQMELMMIWHQKYVLMKYYFEKKKNQN